MSKSKYFSGNNSVRLYYYWALTVFTLLVIFSLKFIFYSEFAATWDQVDFALGVERFDLLAMQPHFPGYPYFILGGMIVNNWVSDTVAALSVFNSLMMLLSSIPIYLLGKRVIVSHTWNSLLVIFIQSFSYISVTTVLPMSEGAALAMLWWYIWGLIYALERETIRAKLLPLFLFSILLGIRLSYLGFGIGILYLLWMDWRRHRSSFRFLVLICIAIFFQLIWVGALIATEGSITGFISLAMSFTNGHFTDWGGAVTASEESFMERFFTIVWHNVFWTGFFSQSYLLFGLSFPLLCFLFLGKGQARNGESKKSIINLLWVLLMTYFIWAFIAQNPDKPRHTIPLNSLISFIGFYHLTYISKYNKSKFFFILLFIVFQLIYSFHLLEEQSEEMPATYQLTTYLENIDSDFIVYTWEEERIMDYLQASYSYKKVLTFPYFLDDISFRKPTNVYITSSVVEGFKLQGIDISSNITEIKVFQSNHLIEPVYHKITLYEWKE